MRMAADQLSATFAALADPRRRDILAHLMSGEASESELAEPLNLSLPAISWHLKVLERAGLIERSREAQRILCRIQGDALQHAAEWLENYRMAWERKLGGLHGYSRELKVKELKAKRLKAKEFKTKELKGKESGQT